MTIRLIFAIAVAFLEAAAPADAIAEPMTIDEFIAGTADDGVRPTPVTSESRPAVYVVVKSDRGGDSVCALDYSPKATVGSAISQAAFPNPISFAATKIALHRVRHQVHDDLSVVAEEEILDVQWNADSNQPTEKTNHRLKPGDRIVLSQSASIDDWLGAADVAAGPYDSAAAPIEPVPMPADSQDSREGESRATRYAAIPAAVPSPFAAAPQQPVAPVPANAPPTPIGAKAAPESATQVLFNIVVVEDLDGSFKEFDQLRSPMPCMLSDTTTIDGTLRILEKHKLVRRIANPKLVVLAGRPATLQIGSVSPNSDEPTQGLQAKVAARELGGGLIVDFSLASAAGSQTREVQTSLIVPAGQTVVLKTDTKSTRSAANESSDNDRAQPAVYVVLTPEIVR